MKNKIILFCIIGTMAFCSSCQKNLNSLYENPDAFTSTSIELLFSQGIVNSVPIQYADAVNRTIGSFAPMMQLLANDNGTPIALKLYKFGAGVSASSAGAVDFGRWGNYYNGSMPAFKEIEKIYNWKLTPAQQAGYKVYYELTKIMEAYNTAQTTDLFGDMPYSQAFTARNSIYGKTVILNPKFDSQESIYDSLLTDLKNASDYLDTVQLRPDLYTAQSLLPNQDVLYGGNLKNWERLANSLRLRYAMRISEADQALAKQIISDIVQNNRPLILDNSSNAVLFNTSQGSDNLFRAVQENDPAGTYAPGYMDSLMQATGDPRLKIFFYTDTSNHGAYTGMPVSYGLRNQSAIGFKGIYAYLNPLTFGYNYSMPNGIMIDAADVNFLLAEAAKKGFISGGDATAVQYYNAGIVQSILAYYQFYTTAPSSQTVGTGTNVYTFNKVALPQPSASSILAWLQSSSYAYDPATGMEQIALQKWMNAFILEIDDNYAEFRRLKLPILPPDIFNGQQLNTTYPLRVPYPSGEQANNTANFNTAAAATDGNSYTVPVWWNK